MPRRVQRGGTLDASITRPNGTTSGAVPGNRDVVRQPGYAMEDDQSASRAGDAVASQWGGAPEAGSPQVGRKQ